MVKSSRHIVFLTPGFPKDEAETYCLPYFQNYLLALHETHPHLCIRIISLNYPTTDEPYHWNGIAVYPLNRNIRGIASKPQLWWSLFSMIRKLHFSQPIGILHSLWLQDTALIGHFTARFLQIRHLCTAMGEDVVGTKNRLLRLLPLAEMDIVAVSDFQRKVFQDGEAVDTKAVIPWGLGEFPEQVSTTRTIDLLNVGDVNEVKQTELFVVTVAQLKQDFPNIQAVIIGLDLKKGAIQRQIQVLALEDNIAFTGRLTNEEVLEYMRQSSILIHSSRYESQGYVFLEALKSGMRIVSRSVGIAEQRAYWFLVKDSTDFIKCTKKALTEKYENQSIIQYPINDTVAAYLRLYGLA